jgi:hypothetical protein
VQELLKELEVLCDCIFSKHTALIPASYPEILHKLKSLPHQSAVHHNELFEKYSHGLNHKRFTIALQYLHAIGRIVVLKNGMVYPDSRIVSQTAAKFVSPGEVRASLLVSENIEILSTDVGNSVNKEYNSLPNVITLLFLFLQ